MSSLTEKEPSQTIEPRYILERDQRMYVRNSKGSRNRKYNNIPHIFSFAYMESTQWNVISLCERLAELEV